MAAFLTLWVLLETEIKGLMLQASWGLLPEWMLDGTVYINVLNRHLIPIPTLIPITTIPTPIPTPPKRTTNDSDSDSDSGIGVGIVVRFRLRSRNRPRSGLRLTEINNTVMTHFCFSPFLLLPILGNFGTCVVSGPTQFDDFRNYF